MNQNYINTNNNKTKFGLIFENDPYLLEISNTALNIISFISLILVISLLLVWFLYLNNFSLFRISSIASPEEIKLISSLIDSNVLFKYSLLYKATRDKSSRTFHEKCNKYNNTITLVFTTDNRRFGGYTEASWECKPFDWVDGDADVSVYTNDTFIFSLNLKNKYRKMSEKTISKM